MDSSALFAAILSSTGGARELIRLAIREEIKLVISEDVITETNRNIGRKAPKLLNNLKMFQRIISFEIVPSPTKEEVRIAEAYVAQKDAFIIAAAIGADVDYVATFDRKHLIDPPEVSRESRLNIDTPGNILGLLRDSTDDS